jgi:hypothetical protein
MHILTKWEAPFTFYSQKSVFANCLENIYGTSSHNNHSLPVGHKYEATIYTLTSFEYIAKAKRKLPLILVCKDKNKSN